MKLTFHNNLVKIFSLKKQKNSWHRREVDHFRCLISEARIGLL